VKGCVVKLIVMKNILIFLNRELYGLKLHFAFCKKHSEIVEQFIWRTKSDKKIREERNTHLLMRFVAYMGKTGQRKMSYDEIMKVVEENEAELK